MDLSESTSRRFILSVFVSVLLSTFVVSSCLLGLFTWFPSTLSPSYDTTESYTSTIWEQNFTGGASPAISELGLGLSPLFLFIFGGIAVFIPSSIAFFVARRKFSIY